MNSALDLIDGISWSLAYIAAIYLGIKRKTWCIPKLPICQNFAWELLMVIYRIQHGTVYGIPFLVQALWLCLDVGILILWLSYDRPLRKKLPRNLVLLVFVMAAMYALAYRTGEWELMAFSINAIMSAAFVVRESRDHSGWTSRFIAAAKMIGTLAATILSGVVFSNLLILWIGGLCFILDMYYLILLSKNKVNEE